MYDLIIIGAGPAGITAGVYAARQKIKTLIIAENIGGQAAWSSTVENYTGFQYISGMELAKTFEEHVKKYALEIKEKEAATKIEKKDNIFEVSTNNNQYQSKTVIIAAGKQSRKLGVSGEEEFRNRGVTYCAICDGPIFAGQKVAIIGGGNSALDAALQMMKMASKVYLINITDKLTGAPVYIEKVRANKNVEVMNKAEIINIYGEKFIEGLTLRQNDKEKKIDVKGIFVEIGLIPNSDFGIEVEKNKYNEIIVNNKNETNIPGLFAAGDVTDVPEKQIVVAAGEGSKACLSAVKYLNSLGGQKGKNKMSKWQCTVCNYIYDPTENDNVPFGDLPADWTCPQCGVTKDKFVEVE